VRASSDDLQRVDPCGFSTEASTALGGQILQATPSVDESIRRCDYFSDGDDLVTVSIFVPRVPSPSEFAARLHGVTAASQDSLAKVANVGDLAFAMSDPEIPEVPTELWVLAGETQFRVVVDRLDESGAVELDAETVLAQAVLAAT
jgi:hypothetical protein